MKRFQAKYLLSIALLMISLPLVGCARARETPATPASGSNGTPAVIAATATLEGTDPTTIAIISTATPTTTPVPAGETAPTNTPVPVISSESLNPTATPVTSLPNPQSSSTTMDSSQSESGVHIVQPGENLYRISLNYDVSMQELARLNGITNPDMIYVGQRLKVPGLMGEGGMAGDGVHIVQPGESLMSIALSYNSSVAALMAANNLANPDFIYVGQRLVIP